jgi:hypothetical protein
MYAFHNLIQLYFCYNLFEIRLKWLIKLIDKKNYYQNFNWSLSYEKLIKKKFDLYLFLIKAFFFK